ncbi:MAG: chemotaxis protein CheD [Spirochaetia bacterium]|nr:chemotaxis protein CheD [Spirochaetia bacterium]
MRGLEMADLKITSDEPEFLLDIFLQPGDFYWGDAETRIRTLLGSCISITMWHPILKEGGMCHFMLPSRPSIQQGGPHTRYADAVMELFLSHVARSKRKPSEYVVKVFGGGSMLREQADNVEIVGQRNIRAAEELLAKNGFKVIASDVGGNVYRRIQFNIWSGDVWVKRKESSAG